MPATTDTVPSFHGLSVGCPPESPSSMGPHGGPHGSRLAEALSDVGSSSGSTGRWDSAIVSGQRKHPFDVFSGLLPIQETRIPLGKRHEDDHQPPALITTFPSCIIRVVALK